MSTVPKLRNSALENMHRGPQSLRYLSINPWGAVRQIGRSGNNSHLLCPSLPSPFLFLENYKSFLSSLTVHLLGKGIMGREKAPPSLSIMALILGFQVSCLRWVTQTLTLKKSVRVETPASMSWLLNSQQLRATPDHITCERCLFTLPFIASCPPSSLHNISQSGSQCEFWCPPTPNWYV